VECFPEVGGQIGPRGVKRGTKALLDSWLVAQDSQSAGFLKPGVQGIERASAVACRVEGDADGQGEMAQQGEEALGVGFLQSGLVGTQHHLSQCPGFPLGEGVEGERLGLKQGGVARVACRDEHGAASPGRDERLKVLTGLDVVENEKGLPGAGDCAPGGGLGRFVFAR
jgi:hypothetical protein